MNKVIVITCEADKTNAILDVLEEASYDDDLGPFDVQVKDELAPAQAETIKKVINIFNGKEGDTNE